MDQHGGGGDACDVGGVVPRTEKLRGDMRHDSIAGFSEFLVKQASHARTMAISMKAEGHKGSVLKLLTSPVGAFVKQAVFKQSWRDGWPGVLAASVSTRVSRCHAESPSLTWA